MFSDFFYDKQYGKLVNTHDLLKFFALLFMVIDHIGFFFFPEIAEFRVVGRFSFPLWFFLIGYGSSQRIQYNIIVLYIVMELIRLILIKSVPNSPDNLLSNANIFLSIIVVRLSNKYCFFPLLDKYSFLILLLIPISMCSVFIYPFSSNFYQYGIFGHLFSLIGYFVRKRRMDSAGRMFFMVVAVSYIISQAISFDFAIYNTLIIFLGMLFISIYLYNFSLAELKIKNQNFVQLTKFLSRNSQYLYLFHYEVFLFLAITLRVYKG